MSQEVEKVAEYSIARGCGFAALGIVTFMFGMAGDIPLAFVCGGTLGVIVSLVLGLKGWRATSHPYKRTEVWLMLEPGSRPNAEIAQRLIGSALRRIYFRYAIYTAQVSAVMLVFAMLFRIGR